MRHSHFALQLLAPLLAAALACSVPGLPGPEEASPPTKAGAEAIPMTPSDPEAEVELGPPPPAGLTDTLQAKVEAGELGCEESLILGLRLLLGEVDPAAAFPQVPTEMEGTGVIRDSQLYLRTDGGPSARAEIARMLPILAPLPETLLPYSTRQAARSSRGPGLAKPREAEKDCADLWPDGFPAPQPNDKPVMCFEYIETKVGSGTVQVFYPITDLPEGFTVGFADAALQAVVDSLKTCGPLAVPGSPTVMNNVQVAFSLLPGKSGAFALTPTDPGHDPCQIVLFPLSIARVSGGPGSAPPKYPLFQQNVAHEVFHCFQIWNFPKQSADATWDVQDWWAESTADYFSNVVYPATDDE